MMIEETKIIIESFKKMVERQTIYQSHYEHLIGKLLGVRLMLVMIDDTLEARKLIDDYIEELQNLQESQKIKMNGVG